MSAGSKRRREHMRYKRTPGSQCLGKLRYTTNQAAQAAINELGGYARAYKCPLCKHLHLTSKPKQVKA